jgi:hypothetical protein
MGTDQQEPMIMLLMGMKMSLTKKPTNPTTTKPIAVRAATLVNSARIESNRIEAAARQIRSDLGASNIRVWGQGI